MSEKVPDVTVEQVPDDIPLRKSDVVADVTLHSSLEPDRPLAREALSNVEYHVDGNDAISLRPSVSEGDQPVAAVEDRISGDVTRVEGGSEGRSFVSAVHEKYCDDTQVEGVAVYIPKSGPVKVTDSGHIVLPKRVSMSGCQICVAGSTQLIEKMCQNVHELDIMENNITDWGEVFKIIHSSPKLTFVNLSKNHLTSELPDLSHYTLPPLTHLVLVNTGVPWRTVTQLLSIFPSLTELHLSLNNYSSTEVPVSTLSFPNLRQLFFCGNKITDWAVVNRLGQMFPSLQCLVFSDTQMEEFSDHLNIPASFPKLQALRLNKTCLKSWDEIVKLRLFPSLTDVWLNSIPFLQKLPEMERREQITALLPAIVQLNGSPITESQREDAERNYIRKCTKAGEDNSRFRELVAVHGMLDQLVEINLKPKSTLNLTVIVETADAQEIKREEMEISVNQTTKALKKMLSNVANHPAGSIHLYYKARFHSYDRMIYPNKELKTYNLQDGDEIVVQCRNQS